MKRSMIIPAAGLGTRLNSSTPKILYPVLGKPMIDSILEKYRDVVQDFILVLHPSFADEVQEYCRNLPYSIEFELQTSPTGMLDAALIPLETIRKRSPDQVWISWCDAVTIRQETIQQLDEISKGHPEIGLIFPTVRRKKPYIHIVRNRKGLIETILHLRENDPMPETGESDVGLFCLSRSTYLEDLPAYSAEANPAGATRENNFLTFIPWLNRRKAIISSTAVDELESLGLNTLDELRQIETYLAPTTKKLSIIIPAYNEERFIGSLIEKVQAVDLSSMAVKEIIVVNDCSTDQTAQIVKRFPGVILKNLEKNSGKGAAVRQGLALATGAYVMFQDADLEYEPADYVPMLNTLIADGLDAVYGSRYSKSGRHQNQAWTAYIGGRSLSVVAFLFTGHYLTDTVTALKLFRKETLEGLTFETRGFELDHEITSKILQRRCKIREVPIQYFPRGKEEGKKIGMRDWFKAVATFCKYRNG